MTTLEAVALFALLFLAWSWFSSKKKSPIIDWPVIGMLHGPLLNASRIHEYFTDVLKQSNHTINIKGPWFSKMNLIFTSDPENVHYILSTKSANYNKGPAFKEIFVDLGDGILAADFDSWKMQRKLTHMLFKQSDFSSFVERSSQEKMETGFFKILDHASENGLEVDMHDLSQRFTFDLACIFLLGVDLNSLSMELPIVPFAVVLEYMEQVILLRHFKPQWLWKLQRWLQIGVEKTATRAIEDVDSFLYTQINLKRASNCRRTESGHVDEKASDFISKLMREEVAVKANNSAIPSDKFLRDAVGNILIAGRDTSSTALAWFFWLVSTNPLVEQKLRDEIRTTFQMKEGEPWSFPSFKELNKLVYLHATLNETLRLYPAVPFNHRAAIEPDILPSGHKVDKEGEVIVSMYAMGRMEELWGADCRAFKPERWISEEGSIIDVPTYKFNVFSAGPRTCVGKDLALMEMKIAAAAITWSYHLQVVKGHPVSPAHSVILHMRHGLKVNVKKRCT